MNDLERFILYRNYKAQIDALTDEQAGILFKAIYHYVENGEVPSICDAAARTALGFICAQIDVDGQKYKLCRKGR